jgi:polysaccharide export outer membrane protein
VLASCGAPQQQMQVENASNVGVAPGGQQARIHALWEKRTGSGAAPEFCLGPGDVMQVSVLNWEEIQGRQVRVSSAGTISLPHIGTIEVTGLTEEQLRERLEHELGRKILRDPQVTVFVTEYGSQEVSVTGAVAEPGLHPLSRDSRTVADLLSEAGGMAQDSGGVVLFYPVGDEPCAATRGARTARLSAGPPDDVTPIAIDLNDQYQPAHENPLNLPVLGGDAIEVNRGSFLVDGWVTTPGAYPLTPGMTALGGLTAAGGASYPADLGEIVIWRTKHDGTKEKIDVDIAAVREGRAKDVTLRAGDVINVPASATKMVPYSGFWVLTNVVRVGAGLTLTGL